MRLLFSKPDALGDQFVAAGAVQALLRLRPDTSIVWHVQAGREAIAPMLGAGVFTPRWQERTPESEAARLAGHSARLLFLPFPLNAHEPWTDDLRRRLAWWSGFLRATAWDAVALGLVNRNWVGDVTAGLAPAPLRVGFTANAMRQPLVNEAHSLLGGGNPGFTRQIPSSFDQSEGRQIMDLLALLEPGLAALACVPVWRPVPPENPRAAAITDTRVCLAPGVGGDTRRAWGMPNFLRVAAALRERGHQITWIEGPGDASFLEGLPETGEHARLRFGPDDLPALADAIATAGLFLCHDTAYAHLAAGLGVPTVAIFGSGQRERFFPLGGRVKVVQGGVPCAGCQWHCLFDRLVCVADIPVDAVLRAIGELANGCQTHRQVELPLPLAGPDGGAALTGRLQEEILRLNADRFARLQIIQSLVETGKNPAPPSPRLSVIIPMGRPERVAATMASLAAQEQKPDHWEIILVGTEAGPVARHYPCLPVVPVALEKNELPSRTRCEGVGRATGEWFLFLDDDVELTPDFLRRWLAMLAAGPDRNRIADAVGPQLPGKSRRFFGRVTDCSNFWAQQGGGAEDRDWLYSAAIFVRAEAYRRSGGFNPDLPNGEDVDLTRRIKAAGCRLRYEPSLIARHDHRRDTLPSMWRYFWRNGNAARYFFLPHGGACCFSLRTVFTKTWRDWRMNREFRQRHGQRLGLMAPWVPLNYLIMELSLEYHYQAYLWHSKAYATLPATTPSDRTYVRAMQALACGRRVQAVVRYLAAMLQDFGNPVRR